MSSGHTPGRLIVTGPHKHGYHIQAAGIKHVAFNIPKKADAVLFAAAPALLQALEGLDSVLCRVLDDHGLAIVDPQDKHLVQLARQALKDAGGEA